ncbi:MAG: hypothetical protein ACF8NJ_00850 [Phycisphaerales bacterium JB038]
MRVHDTQRLGEEQAKVRDRNTVHTKKDALRVMDNIQANGPDEVLLQVIREFIVSLPDNPNAEAIRVLGEMADEIRFAPECENVPIWMVHPEYTIEQAKKRLSLCSISWDDVPPYSRFWIKEDTATRFKTTFGHYVTGGVRGISRKAEELEGGFESGCRVLLDPET